MRQRIKELLIDRSTVEEFRFVLRCMECGREWTSPPVRFSKAGIQPESEGKRVIFQTLYRREWESARERAVAAAGKAFNLCPICGRLVCDNCFLVCDDLDLCAACARRLQVPGELVMNQAAGEEWT